MKNAYNKTITACFLAYIVQAIINNFVPLLFLTFQSDYGIPLSQITLLVTLNFGIQLAVDLLSVGFVDRIGYRASMVLAHLLSGVGLLLLTVLPELLGFGGILFSVMVYAIGGGLLEVLVSPVVEACPSEHKEKAMSMLHSFYCWGHVGVVLLSTAFFYVFGVENWKILALVWAAPSSFERVDLYPGSHGIPDQGGGTGPKNPAAVFYEDPVYPRIPGNLPVSRSPAQPGGLCCVWFVGGNPMAGHLQQRLCHAACRRNCHVCPAGSGWGCRLYPGAHPGGHGLRNRRRQPEAGNPGSCGISPDSVGLPGNFRETAA